MALKKPNRKQLCAAFNEWQRRYIHNPAEFEAQFQSINRTLSLISEGKEPTYGEECVAYLESVLTDLFGDE